MNDASRKASPEKEIFNELFSLLETLEIQNVAILQFLKEEGIATDEKLAPYIDRAGNAASVKWRAHRARMEHLFSSIPAAVQAIKKERESGGEKEEENLKRESEPTGKDEGNRAPERAQAIGASNPITGRVPRQVHAPGNAENKASREYAGHETVADKAGDQKPPSPAKSSYSDAPDPSTSNANLRDESGPRPEAEKAKPAKRS
jgi:hypothetical protein